MSRVGIHFSINSSEVRLLDLTDPIIAKEWGYTGGKISAATQLIGSKAKAQGYNAIRFRSTQGTGINLVILDDFDTILNPIRSFIPLGEE